MKNTMALLITLLACLGCTSKTPVNELTFDALQKVVTDCQATGKIATDDYCKEAATVYGAKVYAKREAERLAKVRARAASMPTDVKVPTF